jgi:DNA (cytosine-5)-methyltransferase 1
MSYIIGSLFSGIGGLELGLERAGLGPVAWQVEIDPFCRLVLEKHWPLAKRFEDVRAVSSAELQPVDLICGGFPCQDVSGAGRGAGLTGTRSGLWSEYARIVGELQPRWVVVENVTSGATRWLDRIVCQLEEQSYECLPIPLSARDVGALHLRRRLFIIANRSSEHRPIQSGWRIGEERPTSVRIDCTSEARRVTDIDSQRKLQPEGGVTEQRRWPSDCPRIGDWGIPESGMAPMVHGISSMLAGRQRRRRIRALGNSVVPQCAEIVGWVIREIEGKCIIK